jgi:hypothetical protein
MIILSGAIRVFRVFRGKQFAACSGLLNRPKHHRLPLPQTS